tara:strand:+ start:324 stop:593 length:270 start_codon:yes stop_codon:yes gene_type:complete
MKDTAATTVNTDQLTAERRDLIKECDHLWNSKIGNRHTLIRALHRRIDVIDAYRFGDLYGTPAEIAEAQDEAMADSILADIERCGYSEY